MRIELKDICKTIKGTTVLDHISYVFEENKVYGLQGHNGSGKTMMIRAICGLIHLTSGEVIIDGKVIGKDIEFPESIGLLLEKPAFLGEYSGFENLRQIASIQGKVTDEMIRAAISEVGLDPDDKKKYRKYSQYHHYAEDNAYDLNDLFSSFEQAGHLRFCCQESVFLYR